MYATGLLATFTWIIEVIDIWKDVYYLFNYKHVWWTYMILVGSITVPFSIIDADYDDHPIAYNLVKYIGLTYTKEEKRARLSSN